MQPRPVLPVPVGPILESSAGPGPSTEATPDGRELVDVTGYGTSRRIAWEGSFEGRTTIGLGVRARLPFRVFALEGPCDGSRPVVDVAHHW